MDVVDVLIVDDDPGVLRAVSEGLGAEGFNVRGASGGAAALDAIAARTPDVIVLDVSMPGVSGLEVVHRIRAEGRTVPVCMLSARDEVDDRVAGLAAGADDYVVKPFSIGELAARLHALVRLHRSLPFRTIEIGDLSIDPSVHEARRGRRPLDLTAREFELLLALARHSGQVLSRQQLLELVWGYTWEVESNVVDVFVGYLRRKLEADGEPRILDTVRGSGFVLRTR